MDRGKYPIQLLVCCSRVVVADVVRCRGMWYWRKNWFVDDCREGVVAGGVVVDDVR